jgi:hypothetical protein
MKISTLTSEGAEILLNPETKLQSILVPASDKIAPHFCGRISPGELVLAAAHREIGLPDFVYKMAREIAENSPDKSVVIISHNKMSPTKALFPQANVCVEKPRVTAEVLEVLRSIPDIALAVIEHPILFMRDDDYVIKFTRELKHTAESLDISILITAQLPLWVNCSETEALFAEKYCVLNTKIIVLRKDYKHE